MGGGRGGYVPVEQSEVALLLEESDCSMAASSQVDKHRGRDGLAGVPTVASRVGFATRAVAENRDKGIGADHAETFTKAKYAREEQRSRPIEAGQADGLQDGHHVHEHDDRLVGRQPVRGKHTS